jgi:hypothetical protein
MLTIEPFKVLTVKGADEVLGSREGKTLRRDPNRESAGCGGRYIEKLAIQQSRRSQNHEGLALASLTLNVPKVRPEMLTFPEPVTSVVIKPELTPGS